MQFRYFISNSKRTNRKAALIRLFALFDGGRRVFICFTWFVLVAALVVHVVVVDVMFTMVIIMQVEVQIVFVIGLVWKAHVLIQEFHVVCRCVPGLGDLKRRLVRRESAGRLVLLRRKLQ